MIIEARRTTPVNVLEMLLDLTALSMAEEAAGVIATYCARRSDQKALELEHGVIWKKAVSR